DSGHVAVHEGGADEFDVPDYDIERKQWLNVL
ncbi:hypothetical protein SS7213T_03405, partial [Staphylococcus simiae CCM 7213 = CCUG 51256]